MIITKRQLKRIIKEEKARLLGEAGAWGAGADPNILADYAILDFAVAWGTLGPPVQEQVLALLEAYGAGGHRPTWEDAIHAQDPAAIRQAMDTLGPSLKKMLDFDEGFDIYSALEDAVKWFADDDVKGK